MAFKKATKAQAKLRAAVFGPSGGGKTFSAMRIAKGLGGKVAVIDSERGSASKYADRFEFDVEELADKTIAGYCQAIKEAAAAGYDVLIIDSLSHAWQELTAEVDKLAHAKYRGNTWSAWSEGTPKQRKLVDAILNFPGHVLATMRSKTEWQTSTNDKGKSQPIRVGLAPEQGKGIEYEFDLLLELTPDHQASIIKDRTGKFQDQILDRPGEEFGEQLAAWLADGVAAPAVPEARPANEPKRDTRTYAQLVADGCTKFGMRKEAVHRQLLSEAVYTERIKDPGGLVDDDLTVELMTAVFLHHREWVIEQLKGILLRWAETSKQMQAESSEQGQGQAA